MQIRTVKKKVVKNIGLLYRANNDLIQALLKVFTFQIFIHTSTTQTLSGQVHKKPN